jgi:endonuclease/exonuclease/phosphatase family metal-dependent hydrolase
MSRRLAVLWLVAIVGGPGCESSPDEPPTSLSVATLNVLHGLFCADETAACRLDERLDLLFAWIETSGCPDVITLQEITTGIEAAIAARAASVCGVTYQVGYERLNSLDDAVVLSRFPITAVATTEFVGGFRHALEVRVDHLAGPVNVIATHLGSVDAVDVCGASCPAECTAAGATTIRECQTVQLADRVAAIQQDGRPLLVTGDFNAEPGSFEYQHVVARGWIDAHAAAGLPECEPVTGVGCTSGRADQDLSDLEDPVLHQIARIDYIFDATASGSRCQLEAAGDGDGDGLATGGFAHLPNPAAPSCGPAPAAICWPSDHSGVLVDLACE